MGDGGDDELGDAVLMIDGEGFFAQIDQCDEEFASVVGVDGAWGVGETDAVLCGDARAWADLSLVANGDGDGEAEGDLDDLAWFNGDGVGHVMAGETGGEIEPGGVGGFVLRQGRAVIESLDADEGCADTPARDLDLGGEVGGVGIFCRGGGGCGGR